MLSMITLVILGTIEAQLLLQTRVLKLSEYNYLLLVLVTSSKCKSEFDFSNERGLYALFFYFVLDGFSGVSSASTGLDAKVPQSSVLFPRRSLVSAKLIESIANIYRFNK